MTDSRGCTKLAQYSVTRPQPLAITLQTDTNVNCDTQSITQSFHALTSGGVPPILISWSSGVVSGNNNQFMTTNSDGLVLVTATDALGCSAITTFNVDIPVLGNAGFNTNSYSYTTYGIYSILR